MRRQLIGIALGIAPLAAAFLHAAEARTAQETYRLEITSTDSTRPATARVRVTGLGYAIGARPPAGAVLLAGDTGTITTPGVIDVWGGPAVIVLDAAPVEPEFRLELRPTSGRVRQFTATGRALRIAHDGSSGVLSVRGGNTSLEVRRPDSR